jgi:hypothetical protein
MTNGQRLDLAVNVSSTSGSQIWPGGRGVFMVEATWGGGTVKLQIQDPQGTWIDVPSASFTANGMMNFDLPPGQIQASITTATAVYAYAIATTSR